MKNPLSALQQNLIGLEPQINSDLSVNSDEMTVSDSKTSQKLNDLKTTILDNIDSNQNISPGQKEIFKTKIENEMNTLIKQSLQERCSVYNTMMSLVDADINKTIEMDFKEKVFGTFIEVPKDKGRESLITIKKFASSETISDADFLKQNFAMNKINEAIGKVKRIIGSKPLTYSNYFKDR